MKKLSILALSATVAITPAYAETTAHYNTPITELTPVTELSTKQADLSFAFDDAENLQAVVMTDKEMAETEGAFLPWVAGAGIGAVGGHFSYMSGAIASGTYNPYYHGASVLGGAGVGLLNPITSGAALLNGAAGVAAGAGAGAFAGHASTLGTNMNIR